MLPGNPTAERPPECGRRAFLGALLALAATGPKARASKANPPAAGIQLYTVRAELTRDFEGTLRTLQGIGYRELEFVGLFGQDLRTVRAVLDKYHMSAPAAHIFPQVAQDLLRDMALGRLTPPVAWARIDAAMQLEHLQSMVEGMLEQAAVLGHQYLVCASVDPQLMASVEGTRRVAEAFQSAGDLCRRNGLTFAFHPHGDDFQIVAGKSAVERVLDATTADRVSLELDFYWAALGRANIPRLLSRYSGRIPLAHVKDLAKPYALNGPASKTAGDEDHFEDVGYGQLNFKQWIPLGRQAGMRHFFFERDASKDPLASARRSYGPFHELLEQS
jgi:sugar phosphate isomerase/epimerase